MKKLFIILTVLFLTTISIKDLSSMTTVGAEENIKVAADRNQHTKKIHLEVFIMGHCPYGPPFASFILKTAAFRPDLFGARIRFIADPGENGLPDCPGGEDELEEDLFQITLQNKFPDTYISYLDCLADKGTHEECYEDLITGHARHVVESFMHSDSALDVLRRDALVCEEEGIDYSPTLLIDGKEYNGSLSVSHVMSWLSMISGDNELLKKYPPPVSFNIYLLVPGKTRIYNFSDLYDALRRLFPAATVKIVTYPFKNLSGKTSRELAEVKKLITSILPDRLPMLVYPQEIKKSVSFPELKSRLVEKDGLFIDRMSDSPVRFLPGRPLHENEIKIFGSGLSPLFLGCIVKIDSLSDQGYDFPPYSISYITSGKGAHPESFGGIAEVEEDLRQIAIELIAPDKLVEYLAERAENPWTSYWEEPLEAVGINPEKIKEVSRGGKAKAILEADRKECNSLEIRGELAIMVNNNEIAYNPTGRSLERILGLLCGAEKDNDEKSVTGRAGTCSGRKE